MKPSNKTALLYCIKSRKIQNNSLFDKVKLWDIGKILLNRQYLGRYNTC